MTLTFLVHLPMETETLAVPVTVSETTFDIGLVRDGGNRPTSLTAREANDAKANGYKPRVVVAPKPELGPEAPKPVPPKK